MKCSSWESMTPAEMEKFVEDGLARIGTPRDVLQRHGIAVRDGKASVPFNSPQPAPVPGVLQGRGLL